MNTARHILCLLVLGALAACSGQAPITRGPELPNLEARAAAEAEAGNFAGAAELYSRLADASRGSQRADFLIEAARNAIEAGDRGRARAWLIDAVSSATDAQRQAIYALDARIELAENRPELALRALDGIRGPTPVELMVDVAEVRGRALFALDRPAEAVAELVEREVWLDDAEAIMTNQRLIWDGLAESTQVQPNTGDPVVDGWLALAPLAASGRGSADFRRELIAWRADYGEHPAAGALLAEMLGEQRLARGAPSQVALLLPLSSGQREAAIAIRDGFLAAHLQSSSGRESTVRVYDTAQLGAREAYLSAQLEGADFIVGPLLRPNVEQIVEQAGFVPTLTLNFAQTELPFMSSLHQFALAPEDEARAIAERAIASGERTAIAIVASNDWGYRVLDAFREEFESRGGRLLDFAGFDPALQDFTPQIRTLLNIDRSEQRHRRLAANLGRQVEFPAPRRRQDVDMILLGADSARAGRLLAPQLRFHDAGDIPTYATSQVYEPATQASDADMNGIMFPDAPLLISQDPITAALGRELESYWPRRAPQLLRFYGMGFDAYRLMQGLYTADLFWPLAGVSGLLDVDATGRIHRSLPFAQFRNGRPAPLPELRTLNSERLIGAR